VAELRPPLVVVAGATASGKTALAIDLAERLAAEGVSAEIISADSRQVYRGMDIGTAKATAAERARNLLARTGVASVAGSAFYRPGHGEDLLRFCFAKEDHALDEACHRLRSL